jgi:hypothetical protein
MRGVNTQESSILKKRTSHLTRNWEEDRASLTRSLSYRDFGRARVPEDLTKLCLGHSKESVTDFYAGGLQNDLAWRQEWCERAGLGFGLRGLQKVEQLVRAKAA